MNYSFSNQRWIILGIFTLIIFIFIARLFYVQIIDDSYKLSASNNVLRYITEYPSRGLIYDRNGELLVYNEAVYDLMITPRQVKNIDTTEFCTLIGIAREDFISKLKKAKSFSPVKSSIFEKQLSAETYATLQEKLYQFSGFFVQPRTLRKYPSPVAAHALGYIGEVDERVITKDSSYALGDYIGISGIEQSYEKELRGKRGLKIMLVDVFNRLKGSFEDGKYDSAAVAGLNLTSTLDAVLQAYGEKLLHGKTGSLVAIEPATGEILAMVSNPSYNPNLLVGRVRTKNYITLLNDSSKPLFNRAMQAYYPPGSTFKLTGALGALEQNIINDQTVFQHSFVVGAKSVACHNHPPVALEGAIQYSCNPYFCNVFRAFVDNRKFGSSENGYNEWRKIMMSFGIGKKIGVDMPHELKGLIPTAEFYDKMHGKGKWRASGIYSLGIGQGELSVNPLQMANIICAIANKGFYYVPHIINAIDGKPNSTRNLAGKHYVLVAPDKFDAVIKGMQKVVEAGTARIARFGNTVVCGKTGTAQNPHGKDHSLFVGFAPMENPKITIAVMVENAGWGADWAAPIASLMMEKYLTDSISRPELELRMVTGNLMNGIVPVPARGSLNKNN